MSWFGSVAIYCTAGSCRSPYRVLRRVAVVVVGAGCVACGKVADAASAPFRWALGLFPKSGCSASVVSLSAGGSGVVGGLSSVSPTVMRLCANALGAAAGPALSLPAVGAAAGSAAACQGGLACRWCDSGRCGGHCGCCGIGCTAGAAWLPAGPSCSCSSDGKCSRMNAVRCWSRTVRLRL